MADRDYRSYGILEQEILDDEQELEPKQIVKVDLDMEHRPTQKQDYDIKSIIPNDIESINPLMIQDEIKEIDALVSQNGIIDIKASVYQDTSKYTEEKAYSSEYNHMNEQVNSTDLEKDISFDSFVRKNPLQGRNTFMKWTIRILTFCVLLMLSPVIAIILGGVGIVFAIAVTTILACIGVGLFMLIGSCFIATQISISLFMLAIFISITLLSFGAILSIIMMIFIRWCIGRVKRYRAARKHRHQRGV